MFPNRALGDNFSWSSGSWGWFLSNPVAKVRGYSRLFVRLFTSRKGTDLL